MDPVTAFEPASGSFGSSVFDHPALAGYRTRRNSPRKIREAARVYADALAGRIDADLFKEAINPQTEYKVRFLMERYPGLYENERGGVQLGLRETMSVTDYQALYVDVLDRLYYGYYNAFPVVNMPLVKRHQLRDFRTVSRYLLDGMVSPFSPTDAAAPPPQTALYGPVPQNGATYGPDTSTAPLQYTPRLWQSMASINWRAFVNDDLGIFRDVAKRLTMQANRGISKYITQFFFQSSGPNTTLYKAGYRNLITTAYGAASSNPPLSIQGIQDAFKILAGMLDSSGNPILMSGTPICFYGPHYEATAKNLQNMLSSQVSVEGGTVNSDGFPSQFVQVANWAIRNMQWIMDPYIPIVASGATGSWGIVLDPEMQERPAVELGTLTGFETPQLFSKLPNTQRMGGGVDPAMGDFYSMNSDTKVVSVFGGVAIDGRSTVASNGSGS